MKPSRRWLRPGVLDPANTFEIYIDGTLNHTIQCERLKAFYLRPCEYIKNVFKRYADENTYRVDCYTDVDSHPDPSDLNKPEKMY